MRTREEHLEWCKERAREYLACGDVRNAVTSMLSDLGKHPETSDCGLAMLGIMLVASGDLSGARRFVEGFR